MQRMKAIHHRMRPWLAGVVAYALALQLILSGAVFQSVHAADDPFGGAFPTCHNPDGAPSHQSGDPDKPAGAHEHCALCVVARASVAVLPTDHIVVIRIAVRLADANPVSDDRIARYHSPTGQFQTGPPVRRHRAG